MKATRKLIGALAALVIAIAVATGSTFAWFTTSQSVSVEAFDLKVTSGQDDLQIALGKPSSDTAAEWEKLKFSRTISSADILKDKDIELDAATSTADSNGLELFAKDESTAAASNTYLEFDLSFYSNKGLSVLLGSNAKVSPKDTAVTAHQIFAWEELTADKYGHDTVKEGERIMARAAHAARVAFISGTTPAGKVWAPNESAANGGNDATQAGFYKGNLAADYYNHALNLSETITTVVPSKPVHPLTSDQYAETSEIIQLAKPTGATANAYYGTVTIKVWLEGTDGDCLNSIFEDLMSVVLNFRGHMNPSPENP